LLTMLVTIGALFVTQAYWFKKSFNLQAEQLDQQINIALRSVAHQLLLLNHDTTSQIPPVNQLASNEFFVHTNSYFTIESLDSLLRQEFDSRNIHLDFDYLILRTVDNEIILGNTILGSNPSAYLIPSLVACQTRTDAKTPHNFKIWITNRTTYLLGHLGIWMYSSVTLLLILGVFTFIMLSIIQSKKLALLKKDFVNNMTHELKTPISTIGLAGEALLDDQMSADPENLRYYVQLIRSENKRLGLLVENVLRAAMLDQGELELFRQPINFHDLLKEVLRNQAIHIKKQSGSTSAKLEATDPVVKGDRTHLTNVVFNLVDNAIKYGGKQPKLLVKSWNEGDFLFVAFEDKGIGIPREHIGKVFDKLYRVPTGHVHDVKGFGLGLSYVQAVMQQHGAEINVVSTAGEGSTFTLVFPQKKKTT
jgi:two-component system phosphate regulon sensor histidine kinase PhoR